MNDNFTTQKQSGVTFVPNGSITCLVIYIRQIFLQAKQNRRFQHDAHDLVVMDICRNGLVKKGISVNVYRNELTTSTDEHLQTHAGGAVGLTVASTCGR